MKIYNHRICSKITNISGADSKNCFTKEYKKVFSKSISYYEQFSWTIKYSYAKNNKKSSNTEKGIITTTCPSDLKVWIVAGESKCPTKSWVAWLTSLKTIYKGVGSYVKDSRNFLIKSQREVRESKAIMIFDAFNIIPHALGLW